jgi:hypothetical protein
MFVDGSEERAILSFYIGAGSNRKIITEVSKKRVSAISIFCLEDESSTFLRNAFIDY